MGGKKDKEPEKYLPCKVSIEFINSFVDKDFKIYTIDKEKVRQYSIKDLLPYGFKF